MKGRHQADLIWRFQVADVQASGPPSGLEVLRRALELGVGSGSRGGGHRAIGTLVTDMQLMARDRAERIDRVLARLPQKPTNLARVLYLRYGPEEWRPMLRKVMPAMSGVAALTNVAKGACERAMGKPPRPRSDDVLLWLESLCNRISLRATVGDDKAVFADVQRAADDLLIEAENAYVAWADRSAAA